MRKIRKSTKQYMIVAFLCTVVVGSASIILCAYFYSNTKKSFLIEYESISNLLNENTKEVFVAVKTIGIGEYITEDKVQKEVVYSSLPNDSFMTKDDMGKLSMLTINEGVHILSTMLAENHSQEDVREVSYEGIMLTSNIASGDVVDVRILYPNGENYIVLSKKSITVTDSLVESYYNLYEEEILRMSSAIVDAYLYPNAILYTTKYIEPSVQTESIVTYIPSKNTIQLIWDSPNIIHIAMKTLNHRNRSELERRQNEFVTPKDKVSSKDIETTENVYYQNSELYVDKDGFTYYQENDNNMSFNEKEEYELGE